MKCGGAVCLHNQIRIIKRHYINSCICYIYIYIWKNFQNALFIGFDVISKTTVHHLTQLTTGYTQPPIWRHPLLASLIVREKKSLSKNIFIYRQLWHSAKNCDKQRVTLYRDLTVYSRILTKIEKKISTIYKNKDIRIRQYLSSSVLLRKVPYITLK